jgi:uncharacterized DUF497 family protein
MKFEWNSVKAASNAKKHKGQELTLKDLAAMVGWSSRVVVEVLLLRRPLTLGMLRKRAGRGA